MAIQHNATVLQIILAVPLFVWAIVSGIMILEDENKGKRATTSADWIMHCAPKWWKRVFFFVVLPLFAALVLCRVYGW